MRIVLAHTQVLLANLRVALAGLVALQTGYVRRMRMWRSISTAHVRSVIAGGPIRKWWLWLISHSEGDAQGLMEVGQETIDKTNASINEALGVVHSLVGPDQYAQNY
jgi:hypothetical protein